MNYLKYYLIVFVLLVSCDDDSSDLEIDPGALRITIGHMCGWCAGVDSLSFTQEVTTYDYWQCSDILADKEKKTDPDTWNTILQLLDPADFRSIDYDECGACYDGCDTWLSLSDSSRYHQIRFVRRDTAVLDPIRPLINYLDSIRLNYQAKAEESNSD